MNTFASGAFSLSFVLNGSSLLVIEYVCIVSVCPMLDMLFPMRERISDEFSTTEIVEDDFVDGGFSDGVSRIARCGSCCRCAKC